MAEYRLYRFAQSYRAALMLNWCGADREARFVDFFGGETRTPAFRQIHVMGEVPVWSTATAGWPVGAIPDCVAARRAKFGGAGEDERREVVRRLLPPDERSPMPKACAACMRARNRWMARPAPSCCRC